MVPGHSIDDGQVAEIGAEQNGGGQTVSKQLVGGGIASIGQHAVGMVGLRSWRHFETCFTDRETHFSNGVHRKVNMVEICVRIDEMVEQHRLGVKLHVAIRCTTLERSGIVVMVAGMGLLGRFSCGCCGWCRCIFLLSLR